MEERTEPFSARGDQTRRWIVDAALRLFEERGYEKTTMRAVATEAGVSLGKACYYFNSKDEVVQGFYERLQERHVLAAGAPRLADLLWLCHMGVSCSGSTTTRRRPARPIVRHFLGLLDDVSGTSGEGAARRSPSRP
jgi:AcrR family transcriptional regulator